MPFNINCFEGRQYKKYIYIYDNNDKARCYTRVLMNCLYLQGLFHPARKVRDVYWKIYNSIYIGSQDALIAHYPQVYNDEKNAYVRYELEYVL